MQGVAGYEQHFQIHTGEDGAKAWRFNRCDCLPNQHACNVMHLEVNVCLQHAPWRQTCIKVHQFARVLVGEAAGGGAMKVVLKVHQLLFHCSFLIWQNTCQPALGQIRDYGAYYCLPYWAAVYTAGKVHFLLLALVTDCGFLYWMPLHRVRPHLIW